MTRLWFSVDLHWLINIFCFDRSVQTLSRRCHICVVNSLIFCDDACATFKSDDHKKTFSLVENLLSGCLELQAALGPWAWLNSSQIFMTLKYKIMYNHNRIYSSLVAVLDGISLSGLQIRQHLYLITLLQTLYFNFGLLFAVHSKTRRGVCVFLWHLTNVSTS